MSPTGRCQWHHLPGEAWGHCRWPRPLCNVSQATFPLSFYLISCLKSYPEHLKTNIYTLFIHLHFHCITVTSWLMEKHVKWWVVRSSDWSTTQEKSTIMWTVSYWTEGRGKKEETETECVVEQERALMPTDLSQAERWLTSLCIFQLLGFLDKNNDLLFRNLKEVREQAQKKI